jgi:alanine dehydrogenase
MDGPIWISERDVVAMMSLPQAVDALRVGLREEALGQAVNMVKTHAVWGAHSTLHAIGAVFEGKGVVGTKVWAHTAGGAMPLLLIIDGNDGSVLAIIEAFALGQMRTGGISGVATDLMAKPDATRFAIIGAGKQSLTQIAAVAAVRRIEHVAVWSPTREKRDRLAERAEAELGLRAVATESLEAAIDGADVVTLATRATEPFLASQMLSSGVHVNAVGAITPERAEFDPALLERATLIAADSPPQVRKLSREFLEGFGGNEKAWQRVLPLSSLLAEGSGRPAGSDLTIFKAMGMGISDLALGAALLDRARATGLGRELPRPVPVQPRLIDQSLEELAQ